LDDPSPLRVQDRRDAPVFRGRSPERDPFGHPDIFSIRGRVFFPEPGLVHFPELKCQSPDVELFGSVLFGDHFQELELSLADLRIFLFAEFQRAHPIILQLQRANNQILVRERLPELELLVTEL
jgi:hypothetical protein